MVTRRTMLTTMASAALCATPAATALSATQPLLQMNLSGAYGQRVRTARRRAFHLHNQPEGSPLHHALTSLWSSVFDQTGGALMVSVLPGDANLKLDDSEAVFDVAAGRFEFVSVAAPIVDGLIPDIALQSMPFAYRSVDEVLRFSEEPAFTQLINEDLSRAGLVLVPGGTFSNGFRIVASKKPVRKLADLEGVKIRVPPSIDIALIFRTLGAVPVVTTISDMNAAFAAGDVEAEENPPGIIREYRLQKFIHNVNITNHMWTGFNTLSNQTFWTSLPSAVRDKIVAIMPGVRAQQVAEQERENADVLDKLHDMKLIKTDITDARERMRPVYAAMLANFSPAARRLAEPLLAGTYH